MLHSDQITHLHQADWLPTKNNPNLHDLMMRMAQNDLYVLMSHEEGQHWAAVSIVTQEGVEESFAEDEAYSLDFWLEHQCEILMDWLGCSASQDELTIRVYFDDICDREEIEKLSGDNYPTIWATFSLNDLKLHCTGVD